MASIHAHPLFTYSPVASTSLSHRPQGRIADHRVISSAALDSSSLRYLISGLDEAAIPLDPKYAACVNKLVVWIAAFF